MVTSVTDSVAVWVIYGAVMLSTADRADCLLVGRV